MHPFIKFISDISDPLIKRNINSFLQSKGCAYSYQRRLPHVGPNGSATQAKELFFALIEKRKSDRKFRKLFKRYVTRASQSLRCIPKEEIFFAIIVNTMLDDYEKDLHKSLIREYHTKEEKRRIKSWSKKKLWRTRINARLSTFDSI